MVRRDRCVFAEQPVLPAGRIRHIEGGSGRKLSDGLDWPHGRPLPRPRLDVIVGQTIWSTESWPFAGAVKVAIVLNQWFVPEPLLMRSVGRRGHSGLAGPRLH